MKKSKITVSFIIAFTLVFVSTVTISAATISPNDNSEIETENGTEITYNNNALNGGINDDINVVIDNNKQLVRSAKASGKNLNVKHQTQQTDYYCGPASASMKVKYLGFNKSQNDMAKLLGTTSSAGTGAGNGAANALNKVASSKAKFSWSWHKYDEVTKIKNHVLTAIDYGNPVMINTLETPGDWCLKGHNTGYDLYHFGVISGYSNFGNAGIYLDPGYGRFSGFVQQQVATMSDLSYAAGQRGYAG